MHCELCDTTDEEDETHFLTSCERMTDIRNRHMPQILQLIPDDGRTEIADSKILLTHLILDAGRPEVTSILHIEPHSRPELESATRDYIYALHVRRAAILRQLNDKTAKSSDKRTESKWVNIVMYVCDTINPYHIMYNYMLQIHVTY